MNRWRLLTMVMALFAVSCGGSDEVAVIERQAAAIGPDEVLEDPEIVACADIEAFALGSHAGESLDVIVDEMARLAALLGTNDALPHLTAMKAAALADEPMADAMDLAAEHLDDASYAACGIPAFTAMYVTTSFSSCFGRAPIAAGTMVPDSTGCETAIAPPFLPCFDEAAGFVPIDCRDGTTVVVRNRAWVAA